MMTKSAGFTDAMPMTTTSLPVVDVGLGHSGAIDFDEIGFLRSGSPRAAVAPDAAQGIAQSTIATRPRGLARRPPIAAPSRWIPR